MDNVQPYLFMMMSSFKDDKSDTAKYMTLLLIIVPMLCRIIPFTEIKDYIIDYFKRNSN